MIKLANVATNTTLTGLSPKLVTYILTPPIQFLSTVISITYSKQSEIKFKKNYRWKSSSDNFTFHYIWKGFQRSSTLLEKEDATECNIFRSNKMEQWHSITRFTLGEKHNILKISTVKSCWC